MKISSTVDNEPQEIQGCLGKDITKPGIYARVGVANPNSARLIVLHQNNKLIYKVWANSGFKLQTAAGSLDCKWVPVKEKFTITFDSTEE